MAVQIQQHTADDLWRLSHEVGDRKRLDLARGEIRELALPGGEHGEVAMKAGRLIANHVREHGLGRVTAAETGYVLSTDPDTVRAPDAGFVSTDRAPGGLPPGYIPFAPDLAVEVVSPNDAAAEIHQKVLEYLQAGTRLVWVLYPQSKTIAVHTSAGAHTLTGKDTLEGGDMLPGFKVVVREVFPE